MSVTLNTRRDITLDAYRRVAWEGEHVVVGPEALKQMERARAEFLALVDADPARHIYGATTAHHYSASSILSPEQRAEYARHIPPYTIGGEAAMHQQPKANIELPSDSPRLPERLSRGMALARFSSFIEGHSAVRPELAREVADLLAHDLALMPLDGGATPMDAGGTGYLFRNLDGRLELKEGMALLNGSPVAAAYVSDVALAARGRLSVIEEVCGLAAEAILAPHEHWAEALGEIWNDPDETAALERMRAVLTGGHGQRRPYQAPVSFRMIPKIVGQVRRATRAAEHAAGVSLRAVGDNPIFLPTTPVRSKPDVITNGSFTNGLASPAIDAVSFAWTSLTLLVERLAADLETNPEGLLGTEPQAVFSIYSWFARVWAEEVRERATPSFLSDGGAAWRKADYVGQCLDRSFAALAALARRTIIVRKRKVPPALEPLASTIDGLFPLNMPIAAQHAPAVRALAEFFTARALPTRVRVPT